MFCCLSPIQRGLSAIYPTPILTTFQIKEVNRGPHADTGEKLPNFFAGTFTGPKIAKIQYFRGDVCDKATAQTTQFWGFRAMGTFSGPSRHPKDVPFVSEFWWGT